MSSDSYTCSGCGQSVDGQAHHQCPGSPTDRLDELEAAVENIGVLMGALCRLAAEAVPDWKDILEGDELDAFREEMEEDDE